MSLLVKGRTIAFVSTYPPTQCGIATFTRELANAIELYEWTPLVVGIDKGETDYADPRVIWRIHRDHEQDYVQAAQFLNALQPTAVSLQHEYGVFGGEFGEYILRFVRMLKVPLFVTLHTVEPQPRDVMKRILREILPPAQGVMVMSHTAIRLLKQVYHMPTLHVRMIPHGAPEVPFANPEIAKGKLGLQSRKVISTFGLISRGKGIEDVITAMQEVVKHHPDALYLVLGQTHPNVRAYEGESYRQSLMAMVEQMGLQENVRFVNSYLSQNMLLRYLSATDIYITPYPNPGQISSGTLTYALAVGCAVVSTPYLYAQEMLADGRGVLVPFRNPQAIADTLNHLLSDDGYRQQLRQRAYQDSRHMTWRSVGAQFCLWLNRQTFVDQPVELLRRQCALSPGVSPDSHVAQPALMAEQTPDAV